MFCFPFSIFCLDSGRYDRTVTQSSASNLADRTETTGSPLSLSSDAVAGNNCRKSFLPLGQWRTMPRAGNVFRGVAQDIDQRAPFDGAGGFAAPQLHHRALDADEAGRAANALSE